MRAGCNILHTIYLYICIMLLLAFMHISELDSGMLEFMHLSKLNLWLVNLEDLRHISGYAAIVVACRLLMANRSLRKIVADCTVLAMASETAALFLMHSTNEYLWHNLLNNVLGTIAGILFLLLARPHWERQFDHRI